MASATVANHPSVAARFDDSVRMRVGRAREAFLAGSTDVARDGDVSLEILSSWSRSRDLGVDPTSAALPTHQPGPLRAKRLAEAAWPILGALAEQCRDSDAWAMLLDRDCVQVSRTVGDERLVRAGEERGGGVGATFRESLVGTNGAGISAERLESFLVVGEEHFREAEHSLASVGVPLRDPFGRLVGFLVMCQRINSANHMIVPYAQNVAQSIDEQLALATDGDERALFEAFSRHSRRPSLPVIGMNEQVFVANNAAQQLLRGGEENDELRKTVLDASQGGQSRLLTVNLGSDRYRVHCRVVELSRGRFGAVASLSRVAEPRPIGGGRALPRVETDPLARAIELGLPALICGEAGSGRAHRAHSVTSVTDVDAQTATADPAEWVTRVGALAETGSVLVRDIDVLPADLRRRTLEVVREGSHWFGATAAAATAELEAEWDVVIEMRPLRDRVPEIPVLVDGLLASLGADGIRCSPEVMSILIRHPWPGNIAQLRRVLASSLVRCTGPVIAIGDLPRQIADSGRRSTGEGLLARTERELYFDALRDADWNRDVAAQALGVSRATMYRRIRQFGFQLPSSR